MMKEAKKNMKISKKGEGVPNLLEYVRFDERYDSEECETTTLYFAAAREILNGFFNESFPEAVSAEISIEFPTDHIEANYASVCMSPTRCNNEMFEDYDWRDVDLPYGDIEKLIDLALIQEVSIYRVEILGKRLLIESNNEYAAKKFACKYSFEEFGMGFTTDVFDVKKLSNEEVEKEYEFYKLQWMLDHQRTLPELIENLQSVRMELDSDSRLDEFTTDLYVLEEFESSGFSGGELWSSYAEWLDNEIIREVTMNSKTGYFKCICDYIEDGERYWEKGNLYSFHKHKYTSPHTNKERFYYDVETELGTWGGVGIGCLIDEEELHEYFIEIWK